MSYPIALNQTGALPQKFPFDLPISGDVTIAFSGTCWSKLPGAICGVTVYLDGKKLGDVPLLFNNASVHQTLPAYFFPVNLDFGPHTIQVSALTDNTVCDQNDFFSLWILT